MEAQRAAADALLNEIEKNIDEAKSFIRRSGAGKKYRT